METSLCTASSSRWEHDRRASDTRARIYKYTYIYIYIGHKYRGECERSSEAVDSSSQGELVQPSKDDHGRYPAKLDASQARDPDRFDAGRVRPLHQGRLAARADSPQLRRDQS